MEPPALPLTLSITINANCVGGRETKNKECVRVQVCARVSQRLASLINAAWAAQAPAAVVCLIRTVRMDVLMRADRAVQCTRLHR